MTVAATSTVKLSPAMTTALQGKIKGVSFAAKLRRGSTHTCSAACLVVLISNVFAYHLRVQEAVTANAAMPLVAGEDVRTPPGTFRIVFGSGILINPVSDGRVGCDVSKKFGGRNWGGAGANHQKLARPVSPSSSTMSSNRPSLRPSSSAPVLSARRLGAHAAPCASPLGC